MRVVLDTNILVRSSYSATGPAAVVLNQVACAPHVLLVSSFILDKLRAVLRYPRLRKLHQFTDARIDEYVTAIAASSLQVDIAPSDVVPLVAADPDDDNIVATAVVGSADALCTRNRHLSHEDVRVDCRQWSIEVMDDVELLRLLRQREGDGEPAVSS